MATDVARVSFDPARRYTDTVPQQGRVTLEAEENEQRAIHAEERLRELREIVGPAGTPDGGYAVSDAGGGDLAIGPGTMYVGGLRVGLDAARKYSAQPDWRDCQGDPAYREARPGDTDEHVVLVLTEYDVTATEDPVLREVALGGPDASARRRIVQRVRRIPTDATDCAGATATDAEAWQAEGLAFDPATMRLVSQTSLLVVWDGPPAAAGPCEPGGSGGYLGAENQNIRVQVCRAGSGTFDVVWGWDNGSALYRATADASANPVLTLGRAPVDDFHRPRAGQPVEVLRAAADLDSTDGVTEGWVAELTGQVGVLAAPYDPDTRTVVFPSSLPAEYRDAALTPQLYVRVWEEVRTGVKSGDTVALKGTGLRVRLTVAAGAQPHVGDFWSIAVRPSTPDTVLPARLLRTPQPPDGPRMWACPLAVVGWTGGQRLQVIEDCRVPFPPLTGVTTGGEGCCTVGVEAEDAQRLQEIIDHATAGRRRGDVTQRITVCLKPGRYELVHPLRLQAAHSGIHLEGCGEGVVLAAVPGHDEEFDNGLVMLLGISDIRITGITFEAPAVPPRGGVFSQGPRSGGEAGGDGSGWGNATGGAGAGGNAELWATKEMQPLAKQVHSVFENLLMSIAVRTVHVVGLTVEDCAFRFGVTPYCMPGEGSTDDASVRLKTAQTTVAAGIFASGVCQDWALRRNTFEDLADEQSRPPIPAYASIGFWLTSSVEGDAASDSDAVTDILTGSVISDNRFAGVSVAVYVMALTGDVDVAGNVVENCYGGMWFNAPDVYRMDLVNRFEVPGADPGAVQAVHDALAATVLDPAALTLATLGRVYPLPEAVPPPEAAPLSAAPGGPDTVPSSPAETTRRFIAQALQTTYTVGNPVSAFAAVSAAAAEARMWRPSGAPETATPAPQPASGAAPAPQPAVDFNGGVGTRAQFTAAAGSAYTGLRELGLSLADLGPHVAEYPHPPMALRFRDNRIRCFQPARVDPSGTVLIPGRSAGALAVNDRIGSELGVLLVTGNDLWSQLSPDKQDSSGDVVHIAVVTRVTITGNVIQRASTPGHALVLAGTGTGIAVTGNVLYGDAVLPQRPDQAPPMDTWWPLNTVIG